MKTNEDLQRDVQNAIKWEPLLKAAEIGVTAKNGVITLTGVVDSYMKKLEAENATKNVTGVKAVVEKIEIKFINSFNKSDNEIAEEIIHAYEWNWEIPNDVIKVKVEKGWVTLQGELTFNYQKEAAKKVIDNLAGIKGVTNNISIKPDPQDRLEKISIELALERNWSIDNEDISVSVTDDKVTLTGTVHSVYQKEEAARIAWNAPGVMSIDNELLIDYDN